MMLGTTIYKFQAVAMHPVIYGFLYHGFVYCRSTPSIGISRSVYVVAWQFIIKYL